MKLNACSGGLSVARTLVDRLSIAPSRPATAPSPCGRYTPWELSSTTLYNEGSGCSLVLESLLMDLDNPVIQLCIEGTQAEFFGQIDRARILYQKAWGSVRDDFDACVAAHYMARHQADPNDIFHWNQLALQKALSLTDHRADSFLPSLYLNMGQSYELLGNEEEANRYYQLAAELGAAHQMNGTETVPDGSEHPDCK